MRNLPDALRVMVGAGLLVSLTQALYVAIQVRVMLRMYADLNETRAERETWRKAFIAKRH